ncbi:SDR family NAD(P)-dependent oxidoreductase [Roseivirga pacifica]|uniref:SDR family NAD(P)-dependent oxidoreductase n=1 Tax=Roseivirga pacifica TaxID=1267423 RepID=UPI00209463E9|nr:SDR family NAD(P)-dependent oxidoreductase [Roseivirga pacifica]MCO6358827.1 SDR family NAD(P)-dependent oxidoreductase [Roseivirga pacifica]MCO6365537.1 SDR family NAD(P)-dependent oxidoreductase [Roseivirga pacifica]MCO6371733.1 SDR family NAD(P)-dependent oxidoreductase [Roseivirga pacifica]MCO6376156.1 SDR family NAD(P)-dependent oxidoreductase [Roseivirga pacifica]MCO6379111.1 SDR family NAD(P)-dependent oxidoreductase [Roseivirga pacifica]
MATTYTLVTGASNGIGRGMAEECAARGRNVLLVALPEPKLGEVTDALKAQYPEQSFHSLGVNLMDRETPQHIFDWCKENDYTVDILVNNAGLGNSGPFSNLPADFYYGQMQLNMMALVSLTHHFLPMLEAQPRAYILNVASMAAFYDIPFKGIYSASKKFVYSFSRSLNKELENSSVRITVLCPASVPTNPDVMQREKELGLMAKLTSQTPAQVAKYTLDMMFKGKPVVIPGFFPRLYKRLGSVVPYNTRLRILAKQFIKNSK